MNESLSFFKSDHTIKGSFAQNVMFPGGNVALQGDGEDFKDIYINLISLFLWNQRKIFLLS